MYFLSFQIKEIVSLFKTGIYEVADACYVPTNFQIGSSKQFVCCDMDTDGGGWIVIQRRINGSVNFYRNWTDYVYGFGDLDGEFWYGLEKIHCLTTQDDVELRIELGNGTKPSEVWTYQLFKVYGAETNYRLIIGPGQGKGGTFDAMAIHNQMQFSTRDRDNDRSNYNCASAYGGAWWYNSCYNSNLNGKYKLHTPEDGGNYSRDYLRLVWHNGSAWIHYTKVEMKIRPKNCDVNEPTTC